MPGAAHPATGQHTWEGQCELGSLARAPLQGSLCPSTPWPFHTAQETPPIDEMEAQEGAKLAWGQVELGCEPLRGRVSPRDGAVAKSTGRGPAPTPHVHFNNSPFTRGAP